MAMQDVLQYKRKLKKPQIRRWVHSRKGDDYYYAYPGTKKRIKKASKLKGDWTVAYKGKEYHPKEFLKKHPKYKLKKKTKKRRK